jgi:hypothetical protein
MTRAQKQLEARQLRYRAARWRENIKNFSDVRAINNISQFADKLHQQADVLDAELALEGGC